MTSENYLKRNFLRFGLFFILSGLFTLNASFNLALDFPEKEASTLKLSETTPGSFALAPKIGIDKDELIFEIVTNQQAANSQTKELTLSNTGDSPLSISGITLSGAFASQFSVSPSSAQTVPAGGSLKFSVTYAPELNEDDLGYQSAELEILSDDGTDPKLIIGLYALKKSGLEGSFEPALNDIVKTLGINVNVGWNTLTTPTEPVLQGEEVAVHLWQKVAGAAAITITPVGRYSPAEVLPFGWYTQSNGQINRNEVGVLADSLLNAQRLYPPLASGTTTADPGNAEFGFYVYSNSFNRNNYTEDSLNTDGVLHRARTYPNKNRKGELVSNSYLVTFEDATNGDYQDYIFVVDNVEPAGASAKAIKVNFAKDPTGAPEGYFNDIGKPYTAKANGYSYGWRNAATNEPADVSNNARNRAVAGVSILQNTLIHMQYGSISDNTANYLPDALWEIEVPNGTYEVTVGVGDPLVDNEATEKPSHTINMEDMTFIKNFIPSGNQGSEGRFSKATTMVGVNDGKLTINPTGGYNTKVDFIEIRPTSRELPFFTNVTPANESKEVKIKEFQINVEIVIPAGYELDKNTTGGNVQLFEITNAGEEILLPSNSNDTGGGDAITLTPRNELKPYTNYAFKLEGIEANKIGDLNNRLTFVNFESTFMTGPEVDTPPPSIDLTGVKFDQVFGGEGLGEGTSEQLFSSLVIGPDGKLYASTLGNFQSDGKIQRWDILPDGTLDNLEVLSPEINGAPHPVTGANDNNTRIIIGFVFDPASTADNLIAYITHSKASLTAGPNWDGQLTRLSGPNLSTVQDLVTHLPRSLKDHLTNSVIFDKNGIMYISQGSNTAGGDPDVAWGQRKESLLSGAVLKLDLKKLPPQLPLDAYTTSDITVINNAPTNNIKMSDGTYNPYAANSPLTIFASGIRNAYDLLWHSNGWLYMPTNGTAGNKTNSPVTPATKDYPLARRIDGRTSIPDAPRMFGGETQKDWMFRTKGGTYHGHPNPYRGEFVLNHGGKPYGGVPGQEKGTFIDVKKYPTTIGPDVNYMEPAYDFGFNKSPNGVIEYQSSAFGGKLKGLIMVTRFSGQNDLMVLKPKDNGDIGEAYTEIPGLSGFNDPLDVIEDTKTGNIYISEYDRDNTGVSRLTLLRAEQPAEKTPLIASNTDKLTFETVINDQGDQAQTKSVTLSNTGTLPLTISKVELKGTFADQFEKITPAGPQTIQPGQNLVYSVTYAPNVDANNLGYQDAKLVFTNNSAVNPAYGINLFALKKKGYEGDLEPALQDIVNALGMGIDVGWTTLTTDTDKTLKGEESGFQQWIQATDSPVTITPVGRYSPAEELPFGWYTNDGQIAPTEVGVLDNGLANAQRLYPPLLSGSDSFDAKGEPFGIYIFSKFFDRYSYTQDDLNQGDVSHKVRAYPVKDGAGNPVENSYLLAFEDASNGDYQDYIFVISNVLPLDGGDFALNFDKEKIDFSVVKNNGGKSAAQQITLTSNGPASPQNIKLEAEEPWIVLPQNAVLNNPMDIFVDASTLAPGTYSGTVTASAKSYSNAVLQVNLVVNTELDYYYQFNFQDINDKVASPPDYVDDYGTSYGIKSTIKGDLQYGWVLPGTLTPAGAQQNGRNRITVSDKNPLLRTFNLMGHRKPETYPLRDWLFKVPNGSYNVNISVGGDPEFSDSNHVLDVNGVTIVSFNESSDTSNRINEQDTKPVEVIDGIMRLKLGQGGVNVKVNYIRIAPQDAALQPPMLTTDFEGFSNEPDSYRGNVKVTLSAEAATTGGSISTLTYALDGAAPIAYDQPFDVNTLGAHTLTVTAEDNNGIQASIDYSFIITQASGALVYVENMTKIPGTKRAFPADDYYTFYRLGKIRYAGTKFHDSNIMRINNTGTAALVVSSIKVSDTASYRYEIVGANNTVGSFPFTIAPGSFKDLNLVFIGSTTNGRNKMFKETISIESNADNDLLATATLHGGFAPQPEGDNNGISDEITAQEVFDAFGFKTNMRSIVNINGTIDPPNSKPTRPDSSFPTAQDIDAGYHGDLILPKAFVQADPSVPIHIVQMSSLHGYTTANAKFVQVKGTATVGGVSATQSKDYYQTLLPKTNSGKLTHATGTNITEPFRIAIERYLNTGGNNINGRNPSVLGLRVYKVIDRDGNVVPNEYIALQDYVQDGCGAGSANCDWNDNTFYLTNIRPQAVPTSEEIAPYFAEVGTPFTYGVAYAFDKAYPGNKLTFTAVLQDGSPLPGWMNFDPLTGTFAGNPPDGSAQSYMFNVTATDLNGLTATSAATITVSEKGSLPEVSLRINAGGPATDYDGKNFVADTYFQGGAAYINAKAAVPTLFKSERSEAKTFGYNIPVPNGRYSVTLHFAEIYWGATGGGPGGIGKRIFNVSLEDELILDNFDITKDADGAQKPVEKTYIINVEDGAVNLNLSSESAVGGKDFPMISALEVISGKPVNTAPEAIASADFLQGYAPMPVSFTGSTSKDDEAVMSYTWSLNGETLSTETDFDYTFEDPGTYDVILTVADREGLESTATLTINAEDPGKPEDFAVRINAGGPTLTFDGKEFAADTYFDGGKTYTNAKATVPALYQTERSALSATFGYAVPVPNGNYTVILHFAEIYFGATGGGDGGAGKRVFDVSIEDSLALNNYDIFKDVGAQTTVTKPFKINVKDNVLNIDLSALANTGGKDQPKISAIEILGIAPPNMAPVAVATADKEEGAAPLTVKFTGAESTDDDAVVSYLWKIGEETVSTEMDFTREFPEAGTYNVILEVADAEGLTDTDTLSIKVNAPREAPVAVAKADEVKGTIPLTVSFTGDDSYDNVGIESFSWKIDGEEVSTQANFPYTFEEVGSYEVTLTVGDADGLTDTARLTITVNAPGIKPTALATSDVNQGSAPLTVAFTGDQSTDNGSITGHSWKIDGEEVSTDPNFEYTFDAPGIYQVTLTVTDETDLSDTATLQITVNTSAADCNLVPKPWTSTDIGVVGVDGSTCFNNGTFEVNASGTGIAQTGDGFHFVYQSLNTNGAIIARVQGVANNDAMTKAGLMIRNGLEPDAVNAFLTVAPDPSNNAKAGYFFQHRKSAGATTEISGMQFLDKGLPYYLKLERRGTLVEAFASVDKENWVLVTSQEIELDGTIYVGLAVSSSQTGTLTKAIFDDVSIQGSGPVEEGTPQLIIYPNPASTFLNLKIANSSRKIMEVMLIDSRGRIIQDFKAMPNSDNFVFEIKNLPILQAGVYILRIKDDQGGFYKERLIISNKLTQ